MRKDRKAAIELRKAGKSYKQIRAELNIPLATLSDWFRDVDWSGEVKRRLQEESKKGNSVRLKELNRVRGEHLERVYEEAREEARKELETLKYNPAFISGIMLYWGEGDKLTKHITRLSNSDPELIRFYVDFLRKTCRIPEAKIRVQLLIYPDIEEESNRRFWSFASGLDLNHFTKSILIQGRHETKRLRYGVCTVLVSSTYFKVKMLEWLRLLPKELMNKAYYESISH